MTFLVVFLKILLVSFMIMIFSLGKRLYLDYKSLASTPDYDEMTIYGRLIMNAMLAGSLLGMAFLFLFSAFIVLSKVSIVTIF